MTEKFDNVLLVLRLDATNKKKYKLPRWFVIRQVPFDFRGGRIMDRPTANKKQILENQIFKRKFNSRIGYS